MDVLKSEIVRQINENQNFIDSNAIYDFDLISQKINNLLIDGEINFNNLSYLSSIPYLSSEMPSLFQLCDDYTRLDRIKQLFIKGLANINVEVYAEIINGGSSSFLKFIDECGLTQDQIECMISSLKGNDIGINNNWIKNYNNKIIELITKENTRQIKDIKESINSLKNILSSLQYQEYIVSNNSHNRNVNIQEIYRNIKSLRQRNEFLNNLINNVFSGDVINPCENYDDLDKLLTFVEESNLNDDEKLTVILKIFSINKNYIETLRRQSITNIEDQIDVNASEVIEELVNQNEDQEEVIESSTTLNKNLTIDDIIDLNHIDSLNLTEVEKSKIESIVDHIKKYISSSNVTNSIFNDSDNVYFVEEIENNNSISISEIIIDGSYIEWDIILTYIHNHQTDKNAIIKISDIVSDVLLKQQQLIERSKKLEQRSAEKMDMELEIDEYIQEVTLNYSSNVEDEYNKIIVALSSFKSKLSIIDDESLLDDDKYDNIIKDYELLEAMFNDYYNKCSQVELKEMVSTFDAKEDNYIVFDKKAKKLISKCNEKFYLEQIIYAINYLRSKEKMSHISNDTNVKSMNSGIVSLYEIKPKKLRFFFTKINNNTYYVAGFMEKTTEGGRLVNETMNRFSEIGNRCAEELKTEFKTLTQAQIHKFCEDSYQEVINMINGKIKKKGATQLGGGIDGDN